MKAPRSHRVRFAASAMATGLLLAAGAAAPAQTSTAATPASNGAGPWWATLAVAGISALASIFVVVLQKQADKKLAAVNATVDGQHAILTAELGNQTAALQNSLQQKLETVKTDLQSHLEAVKADLTASEDVRKAQYEEIARKRELLQQLWDSQTRAAIGQAAWMALAARQKGFKRQPKLEKLLENNQDDWKQTLYRLFAPLAAADLIGQDMRGIVEDRQAPLVRALIACLLNSYGDGMEIAAVDPALPYEPGTPPSAERAADVAVYAVQHLPNVQPMLATFRLPNALGIAPESVYLDFFSKVSHFESAIRDAGAIFARFHPRRRPVTWRIIMVQIFAYRALGALALRPEEQPRSVVEGLAAEPQTKRGFDWRSPADDLGEVADDSPLLNPFEPAKRFVLQRVASAV